MNTQKRNQSSLLVLAALLTLPTGVRAATQATTGFNAAGGQSIDSSSSVHLPADETNVASPAQVQDAIDRVGGTDDSASAATAPVDLSGSGSVDLRLNTDSAKAAIAATGFASRDQAIGIAERGANEGRTIAGAIESSASRLQTDARADVEKAMRKADQARDRLNQAIERGRNSTEGRWDNAREDLSDRYEQYANALEKARDTAVGNGARLDAQAAAAANGPVVHE